MSGHIIRLMSYRPFLFYSKQNFTVILLVIIKAFRPFDLENLNDSRLQYFMLILSQIDRIDKLETRIPGIFIWWRPLL